MKIQRNTIFLFISLILALIFIFFEASADNDFRIYLNASSDIFPGKNIYTEHYKDGFHYFYSPLFAIIITPFNHIPLFVSQFIWLLIDLILVIRSWNILSRMLGFVFLSEKQKIIFNLICFLIVMRFLRDNFHYGQVTILMLYLSLEGLNLIFSKREIAGAVLIALGINIKIFPVVLIPYLLYRREFKAAVFVFIFYGIFLILPSLIIGHQQNMFLLSEWWTLINPSNKEHMIDTEETSFHGLSTLIPTLFMDSVPDPHALALKRNIANLNVEQVSYILNGLRAFFILLTFYFLRTFPFKQNVSPSHRFWELSYLFLIIPLIFPHQQHYAFYLSLPAVFYLIKFIWQEKNIRKRNILIAIMSLIFLIFNANLLLGEFKAYYDHYKIVSYGALMMVAMLMICKPYEEIKK